MIKTIQKSLLGLALISSVAWAGNPDRAGGAGGANTLLNPYARSASMMGANSAYLRGVEAMHFNVGGLAYVKGTELMANRVSYLQGTDIFLNNFSLGQQLGDGHVFGLTFTSLQLGDILIRTEQQPDGTLGTFTPQVINIGFAYAKEFSNSITAGFVTRLVSEGVADARATGIAFDFGVQYQTALNAKNKLKKEDFRFGIGVRNIGPDMQYGGSGLSFRSINPQTGADRRAQYITERFNHPALMNIGVSYDMRLDKNPDTYFHRLTANGNFNYNAFSSNVVSVGGEYAYKETFMLRAGYGYQENIINSDYRTQYYGMCGGVGMVLPVSKNGLKMAIDYSYAPTRVFNGVHNLSLRLIIPSKED
jgi:hypothetical protein